MAGRTRMQVGSGPWIAEERSSANQIVDSEVEEFTFSVQNDFDWLNEHMADVFSESQIDVAEIFKTPGKLRGKTPRTVRKGNVGENRVPLSNIFSSTPKNGPNPFAIPNHSRTNSPRVKIAADPLPSPTKAVAPSSPLKSTVFSGPVLPKPKPVSMTDSGYHGSQSQDTMEIDDTAELDETTRSFSRHGSIDAGDEVLQESSSPEELRSSTRPSPDMDCDMDAGDMSPRPSTANTEADASPIKKSAHHESTTPKGSPILPSFVDVKESPMPADTPERTHTPSDDPPEADPDAMETAMGSPSDGSSPIRPIVRKSSLNFASLPAREPITHKSIGNRVSRTSHLEQNRTSYYRHTGGKSLGHGQQDLTDEENDEMDVDEYSAPANPQVDVQVENAAVHNKTYTQRLQDQINKLGKPQASGPQTSKIATDSATLQVSPVTNILPQPTPSRQFLSPRKAAITPGAFPEDDDDWIEPLGTPDDASNFKSPRPGLPKSYTTDVMEGVSGKNTVGEQDFMAPPTHPHMAHDKSPQRSPALERTAGAFGHQKSASVPVFPMLGQDHDEENDLKKVTSTSNPSLATVSEDEQPTTPKSPSHRFNNSPLKQVKNKLSSILKSSRGLLASSAAISAEGKSSLLSPSTTRLGLHHGSSAETVQSQSPKEPQPLYPDLSRQVTDTQNAVNAASPERVEGRRTRASIEREKAEEKRKREEAKESKRVAEQAEKLEKAREKEREKARVLGKEQERIAAMEKQVSDQRDQEKRSALATPGNATKSAKSSPRKTKQQISSDDQDADALGTDGEDAEVEMVDAPNPMPPPSISRPVAPSSAMKTREIKRPVKPTKEPMTKAKQAPTVIRVNMGSQHSQYHPSNSTLSSNLHDTLSQPSSKIKGNQPSLQAKRSLQSLKSSTSSSGRPKALEAAARRKEQEEREAQRRRDAKAELDRKRVAMQEEEKRQEQQRKLELERQKEDERKQALAQAEAKKNAQRQAMIEKAKQTRAPPPAVRSQPNGPPDYNKSEVGPARPPSRLGSIVPRSLEDASRPVNAVLLNASKSQMKRPLPQETGDDNTSRPGQVRSANGLQPKDSKRMRMTDELNDPVENEKQPSLKGAPVRPSGGFKKDLPTKQIFPAGYANAPPQSVTRDLFKATVTGQHNGQVKTAHPLDMAQVSKGTIPFAPSSHAGPSKTPARTTGIAVAKSTAKSAARSSPRFQNGDSIELPEINTDDEDEDDDDDDKGIVADWADSPNLRRALVEQENKNPFEVFGAPAPLNMEEVFARSKDRFPKFRARTSSANWSGPDGLTEEDIRKDLAAREKMRREGGWSYDMGREMI